jgi:hypothetical protein
MQAHGRRIGPGRTARTAVAGAAVAVLVVVGTTAAGASATKVAKPSPRPSLPLAVQVTPGPGQLVVSWSPPAYTGAFLNRFGVDVPYVITDYDLKGVPAKSWASCVDLDRTCTVTGLKPGHTYQVGVKVWNAKGAHSGWTAPVAGTPS